MSESSKGRPILRLALSAMNIADSSRLQAALSKIGAQDASIKINAQPQEGYFSLDGGTTSDLDSICDRLQREHHLAIKVGALTAILVETIRRQAEAEGKYIRQVGGSGNYGHCKLRVEPNEPGKGYDFINDIKGGVVPKEYIKPIDQGVQGAMELGILAGFQMVDIKVTLFDGSYHEGDSNEMAFKFAGSIALKEAARKASPVLLEPVMAVEVMVPEEFMGVIIGDIKSHRGRIKGMEHAAGMQLIKAIVPLAELLRSPRFNESSMEFAGYEEVPNWGGFDKTEPGVPAILPRHPNQGQGSVAARRESETD